MTDTEIGAGELAKLLGVSRRMIPDLASRGIIKPVKRGRYPLAESVTGYCGYLRGVASGRGGEDQVYELTAERARLAKEQADAHEMKNAISRGELVEADHVRRVWADTLRKVRAAILASPSRLRQRLPHLTAHDVEALDGELRRALSEAATDE